MNIKRDRENRNDDDLPSNREFRYKLKLVSGTASAHRKSTSQQNQMKYLKIFVIMNQVSDYCDNSGHTHKSISAIG